MVNTKEKGLKLFEILLFIYLILFPFGQLLNLNIKLGQRFLTLHLTDVLVVMSTFCIFTNKIKFPKVFKQILVFIMVCIFSLLFSLLMFDITAVFNGLLYLVRFITYVLFFANTFNLVRKNAGYKTILFNSLILVCVFIAIFGWIQYFWIPDLISLKILGWDDHLNRLVGTFLDPGFTSILLVLGFLLTLTKTVKEKKPKYIPVLLFLLTSIAFTYARAAYFALIIGMVTFSFLEKRKIALCAVFAFLIILPLLPRPFGEGVRLERTHSVAAKLENYKETFQIIKLNPLFGIGFNNICAARLNLFKGSSQSHACGGSDSSLLFVIATTGVLGFLVFVNMTVQVLKAVEPNVFGRAFLVCFLALFVHSLFVHSLFYPWVMGFMGILLAISVENRWNS